MLGRGACAIALSALGLGGPASGAALSGARASRQETAVLAQDSNPGHYAGTTSQQQPITFTIAAGTVKKLNFWIVIGCKSHHHYRLRASGFAPIAIRAGRFAALVSSEHPSASAGVVGRVRNGRVTGSVHLTRYVPAEHGPCSGAATYSVGHP